MIKLNIISKLWLAFIFVNQETVSAVRYVNFKIKNIFNSSQVKMSVLLIMVCFLTNFAQRSIDFFIIHYFRTI